MKKLFIILGSSLLFACHGNEIASSQPSDLDRTNNNDTGAIHTDSSGTMKKDSADTSNLKKN